MLKLKKETSKKELVECVLQCLKPNVYVDNHSCWKVVEKNLCKMTNNAVSWLSTLIACKTTENNEINLTVTRNRKQLRWYVNLNEKYFATIDYYPSMAYRSYRVSFGEELKIYNGARQSMTYETLDSAYQAVMSRALKTKIFKEINCKTKIFKEIN